MLPVYTHALVPAQYGLLETALRFVNVCLLIGFLGIRQAYVRFYFDNPSAGELPDFLESARPGLANGGLERGAGSTPSGWVHDESDAHHRTSWVTEQPQDGRRCLKTVVDEGAEPTWISTRQSGVPGRMTGITGKAGSVAWRVSASWYS